MNLFTAELIGLVTGGRSGERDRSLLSAEAVGEVLDRAAPSPAVCFSATAL